MVFYVERYNFIFFIQFTYFYFLIFFVFLSNILLQILYLVIYIDDVILNMINEVTILKLEWKLSLFISAFIFTELICLYKIIS